MTTSRQAAIIVISSTNGGRQFDMDAPEAKSQRTDPLRPSPTGLASDHLANLQASRGLQNHAGCFPANHDRGCVGVGAYEFRHDRGIVVRIRPAFLAGIDFLAAQTVERGLRMEFAGQAEGMAVENPVRLRCQMVVGDPGQIGGAGGLQTARVRPEPAPVNVWP